MSMESTRKRNGKVLSMECEEANGIELTPGFSAIMSRACDRFFEKRDMVRKVNFFNYRNPRKEEGK